MTISIQNQPTSRTNYIEQVNYIDEIAFYYWDEIETVSCNTPIEPTVCIWKIKWKQS